MAKKRLKNKRTTLALVESPAQLLNVIEWAHQHEALEETRLAVLPPREVTTRLQLETMVDLARDAGLAATWHEPRRSAASLVAVAWELFPRLAKAERLVIGDPFSRFVQAVLPLADVAEVVVVDDGTATISFISQLTRGDRLTRWHRRDRSARPPVGSQLGGLARGQIADEGAPPTRPPSPAAGWVCSPACRWSCPGPPYAATTTPGCGPRTPRRWSRRPPT